MSARENMAFGLRQRGVRAAEVAQRLRDAAAMLQLEPLLDRKPRDLSGGERQRVAIGRAIVRQPRVFLLDEPLSNLDASLRLATRMRLAQLHRDLAESTMVYVTHDQVEAMTLADRIVLLRPLRDGVGASVAQNGAPLALYHHPANRFAAGFIGAPPMNFLEGSVETASEARIEVRVGSHRLSACVQGAGCSPGTPLTLGIRPEHVALDGGPLAARVTYVERLGESTTVQLDVAGLTPLTARSSRETIAVGDHVRIDLPAHAMHAFLADGAALRRQRGRPPSPSTSR